MFLTFNDLLNAPELMLHRKKKSIGQAKHSKMWKDELTESGLMPFQYS
jgi:hypothetical protein